MREFEEAFIGGLIAAWASGEAEEIVQPSPQNRRFFSATAMAGRLYVQGVPDKGPWNHGGLVYWTEEQVDKVLYENVGDRKIGTPTELRAALRASGMRGLPAVKLWITEGLEARGDAGVGADDLREGWTGTQRLNPRGLRGIRTMKVASIALT